MIMIEVKASTMVKPMPPKPTTTVWISNLDAAFPDSYYTRTHTFYRSTGAADFFNATLLKAALARTLSEFYPIAGRLDKDDDRIIDCNGEGALFVEAEAHGDLDDFAGRPDICLTPQLDYSSLDSSFPLLLVQVTRFKCGGVCLGIAMNHKTQDGVCAMHMRATWSDIARGLDIAAPPFLDRRVLAARSPPQIKFDHIEFQPRQPLKTPQPNSKVSGERKFSVVKLTREQLNILKASCQEDDGERSSYTSFEVLTGHAWKCICKARRLPRDQETRLFVMVDGRRRLQPPLPAGYVGNAIFKAPVSALSGEVESDSLKPTVAKIHETLARMDDEYMRSAIDYLEVHGDLHPDARVPELYNGVNVGITSWARIPFYDVDFGWGRPSFFGLGFVPADGYLILLPSPVNDGSLSLAITLPEDQMKLFQQTFYDI